jgi:hypothetical protein
MFFEFKLFLKSTTRDRDNSLQPKENHAVSYFGKIQIQPFSDYQNCY